jgi:hypothetical protein
MLLVVEWTSQDRSQVRPLFEAHKRGIGIIFPAINQSRGHLWVDSLESPKVARLQLSVLNVFAGDSTVDAARELVKMFEPMQVGFGPDANWTRLLKEVWGESLGVQRRVFFSPKSLDIDHLKNLQSQLPAGYKLERMDLETIRRVDKRRAMHIPMFFGTSEDFYKMGIAFCVKFEDKVVSMASTFTPYTDQFEIQVDTPDEVHRRKGLATAVSAALIVHALENGLTPHWDAANEPSVQLALKLGYSNPDRWEAYFLKPVVSSD